VGSDIRRSVAGRCDVSLGRALKAAGGGYEAGSPPDTKGREDLDVALKDRRARRWCEDATRLAGRAWAYEKVGQAAFDAYTGGDLDGLRRFIAANEDQP
jgi:hypothetical protein